MKKHNLKASVSAAAIALSLALGAQTAQAQDAVLPLPPVQQSGNVSWVSGGVPDEQLPAIEAAKRDYPLVLELYQKAGAKSEYTAGADIRIKNGKGDVLLDAKSTGPFFLVRMPPGTYHVEATLEDKAISKKGVSVPSKGSRRVVFVFPEGTD